MDQHKIDRLNALARKAKAPDGLTAAETAEREALRQQYIRAVKQNLEHHLDHTVIQYPNGLRVPLKKKEKQV